MNDYIIENELQSFLERLAPLDSEYKKSVSHKKSVHARLRKSFGCTHFFETGSFGNDTGVKHYSDTDYFAVFPDLHAGRNSKTVLREVKEALQYTFRKTAPKIKVNSPSVIIPFGTHASENLEITPCFYNAIIDTPNGRKRSYGIPDGDGGWMLSSPRAHKAYVAHYNTRLSYRLKPLITLIKAWKYFQGAFISSFYLELRITKLMEGRQKVNYSADLYGIVKKLYDIELADIRDPMQVSGMVKACKTNERKNAALSKLKTACSRAAKAHALRSGDSNMSINWWKKFYGLK